MRLAARLSMLAIAAALSAAGTAVVTPAAFAAQRDWTATIAASPEGGFRIGNPNAPVKLIEYGSLTCSHCAHFEEEGVPLLLKNFVRDGRVSFEFRNFVRDPADLAAALLSRCAGTNRYFAFTGQIFDSQNQWIERLRTLPPAEMDAISALPRAQMLIRIASLTGFDSVAARHGLAEASVKSCLSNEKAVARLIEMHRVAAEQHGVSATPTFLINGKTAQGAHNWTALEPLLGRPAG